MAQLPHLCTRSRKYGVSHMAGTAVFASPHCWVDMGSACSTESSQWVARPRSSPDTYRVERAGELSALTSVPVIKRNYSRSVST